jgi:hypothetical protein
MDQPSSFKLVGSYKFNEQTELWDAMVCKQMPGSMEVLCVGVHTSRGDAAKWCVDTITAMRESGNLKVQAPDAIDEAKAVENTLKHLH